jgi:hypothetical protein
VHGWRNSTVCAPRCQSPCADVCAAAPGCAIAGAPA